MLTTIMAIHSMEMATEKTQNIAQNIILPTKTNTTGMGMMYMAMATIQIRTVVIMGKKQPQIFIIIQSIQAIYSSPDVNIRIF